MFSDQNFIDFQKFSGIWISLMALPNIDQDFLLKFLARLLNTPSPTGFAERAIAFTEETLRTFPELVLSRNRKGALLAQWPGESEDQPRALTAHVDTLGAMVKDIKPNFSAYLSHSAYLVIMDVRSELVLILLDLASF